ncbi:uncharacterized protein F5Z01DRAFT_640077 [Emericellopsis atlantica]|uniref:Uncharacterized protein n=1 Tax=Emericellopsis atlantica TaxID=2614577 RepID=A0A9P7ZFM5_9HYPO|nr:uncharacterized protein F5Z01DRAFT_640077 [Emericellopsis atlantica]KAG9250670.1 hypothetical protein F5Z01DRAFT_640077 [Emericellopsis atlantica]
MDGYGWTGHEWTATNGRLRTDGYERPALRTDGHERPALRTDGHERPALRTDGHERPALRTDGYDWPAPRTKRGTNRTRHERTATNGRLRTDGYERTATNGRLRTDGTTNRRLRMDGATNRTRHEQNAPRTERATNRTRHEQNAPRTERATSRPRLDTYRVISVAWQVWPSWEELIGDGNYVFLNGTAASLAYSGTMLSVLRVDEPSLPEAFD